MVVSDVIRCPPVRKGDKCFLKIVGIGEKNHPLGKIDNFVIFVSDPNRLLSVGDDCEVVVTRVVSRCGFADLVGGD